MSPVCSHAGHMTHVGRAHAIGRPDKVEQPFIKCIEIGFIISADPQKRIPSICIHDPFEIFTYFLKACSQLIAVHRFSPFPGPF